MNQPLRAMCSLQQACLACLSAIRWSTAQLLWTGKSRAAHLVMERAAVQEQRDVGAHVGVVAWVGDHAVTVQLRHIWSRLARRPVHAQLSDHGGRAKACPRACIKPWHSAQSCSCPRAVLLATPQFKGADVHRPAWPHTTGCTSEAGKPHLSKVRYSGRYWPRLLSLVVAGSAATPSCVACRTCMLGSISVDGSVPLRSSSSSQVSNLSLSNLVLVVCWLLAGRVAMAGAVCRAAQGGSSRFDGVDAREGVVGQAQDEQRGGCEVGEGASQPACTAAKSAPHAWLTRQGQTCASKHTAAQRHRQVSRHAGTAARNQRHARVVGHGKDLGAHVGDVGHGASEVAAGHKIVSSDVHVHTLRAAYRQDAASLQSTRSGTLRAAHVSVRG